MQVLSQAPPFPVRRLVEFAEPSADDVCLEIGAEPVIAPALGPRVRDATTADAAALPGGSFTLVTAMMALTRATDPAALAQTMLRVCRGRLALAEPLRMRPGDLMGGRWSRRGLIELLAEAGGEMRRLDVLTIERPLQPWLAQVTDPDRVRDELAAEIDGGPSTGARPRLVGGELWFTQTWAYVAAEPGAPGGTGEVRHGGE